LAIEGMLPILLKKIERSDTTNQQSTIDNRKSNVETEPT